MHDVQLENVDLNLLPALAALLTERQISRAAERTGLSQSAMSRAFQRLRRTLRDDLLVRDRSGYRLTPRAERIRERLDTLLPQLGEIFTAEAFTPAHLTQTIRVAGSDYAAAVLGIPLTGRVLAAAPRATLRFLPWHAGVFDDLDRGALDLALFGAQAPARLHSTVVGTDRFVCLVDESHPWAAHPPAGLSDYLAQRHLIIDIVDGSQPAVDRVLAGRGTPRRVAGVVPFHAVAPRMLPGTSLVLTYPERLVATFAAAPGLRVVPAPPEIGTMMYRMAWHPRLDTDPAHRWLRDTVRATALTGQRTPEP